MAAMMQAVIDRGITTENAAAFQTMCDTMLKLRSLDAKEAFMASKAALLADLPHINATRAVMNKADRGGGIRYKYAPYDEILATLKPYLKKHGFSVSFGQRVETDGKRLTALCHVSHIGGHTETNEFSVRTSAPMGCSDAQADGATMSYAQRYALLAAFAIAVDTDTDARIEGATITPEEARKLKADFEAAELPPVAAAAFWKLAAATEFANIREGKLSVLRKVLAGKIKAQPAASDNPADGTTGGETGAAAAKAAVPAPVKALTPKQQLLAWAMKTAKSKDDAALKDTVRQEYKKRFGDWPADPMTDKEIAKLLAELAEREPGGE
jgi:hypothetical protein